MGDATAAVVEEEEAVKEAAATAVEEEEVAAVVVEAEAEAVVHQPGVQITVSSSVVIFKVTLVFNRQVPTFVWFFRPTSNWFMARPERSHARSW